MVSLRNLLSSLALARLPRTATCIEALRAQWHAAARTFGGSNGRSAAEPGGHRRVRVHRIHRARQPGARRAVREHGLRGRRAASLQGRHALPPGRRQLHPESRARQLRAIVRARARPVGVRLRDPREGRRRGLQARDRARREAAPRQSRADGAQHPGDPRHRRQPDLSRRSLRRPFHLRRGFRR